MPWKKRKNGGLIAEYLTEGEATVFWQKNKSIGAGITARMMKAGGGKVTVSPFVDEQQAARQQARTEVGIPANSPSGEGAPAKPALKRPSSDTGNSKKRDKFWRPGFG